MGTGVRREGDGNRRGHEEKKREKKRRRIERKEEKAGTQRRNKGKGWGKNVEWKTEKQEGEGGET